ncbi:hypothetical protein OEB99_12890 [Actinotalea sp. M2MS4P-6]|uniref:hypothetical protein n=1 Tax=Actinotalea sp. M2MS4P-6 TaxID=2983762 RepID=UPI0021E4011A|nr:hypothetical protein [Actinotalea sp. M2MS4P-6]MCV2395207.1 hypothetical protein [Actinotalea sp. M2MS4P-6]
MRSILRLAAVALAGSLVLASPGMAAADETGAGEETAAAEGSDPTATGDESGDGSTDGSGATDGTTDGDATEPGDPADAGGDDTACDPADDTDPPTDGSGDATATDGATEDPATAEPDPDGAPSDSSSDSSECPAGDGSTGDATEDPGDGSTDPTEDPATDGSTDPDVADPPSDGSTGEPGTPAEDPASETPGEPTDGLSEDPADTTDGLSEEPAQDAEPAAGPITTVKPPAVVPARPVSSTAPLTVPPAVTTTTTPLRTTPLPVLTSVPKGPAPLSVAAVGVDTYPAYDPQVFCDPAPKPGTVYLAQLAISYFGQGHLSGISRDCSIGTTSEHKEGRAFDWALSVNVPEEKAAGDAFVQWLTAIGPDGKVGYNARRLGVMYIIWNKQIWMNTSADAAWHDYYGPKPHTDHVHVSLTWAGAYERTSWWMAGTPAGQDSMVRYAKQVWADLLSRELGTDWLDAWIIRSDGTQAATAVSAARSHAYTVGVLTDLYRWLMDRLVEATSPQFWPVRTGGTMRVF